jgi:predicted dehydrogenase/threonine dehydrogenase-like Zn-dependent dehydrogenase
VKQVVQPISGGQVQVIDVPRPQWGATEVLVQTSTSLISPGTEGALTTLARSSLLAKARARPDLVRQVIKKAKAEGVASASRAVRTRLDEYLPLGYSAAGVVLEVGDAVAGVRPGQRVATGGAGKANHAEFQSVPGLLTVPIPEEVTDQQASFATLTSIAMHGLRLADVQLGSYVVVVGLGLVGQLATRLALAAGHRVFGLDVRDFPLSFATSQGAKAAVDRGEATTADILDWSSGAGADAVLIAAGGKSSTAIMRSPEICRDRGDVVVIGDVGLELERAPFYEKEITLRFARSYGPGRYERAYEDWAVDYPPGHVRWTEGRNLRAALDLMADRKLRVDDLVTHSFPIEKAASAYDLIQRSEEPYLGIALTYPEREEGRVRRIPINPARVVERPGVGLIGAGNFARSVLVPSMKRAGFHRFVSVTSQTGTTARQLAEKAGFEAIVEDAEAVIQDSEVELVVIATPHDSHADLTVRGLAANKHVFCEKPLALTMDELDDVERALASSSGSLFVGFNRRWSGPVQMVKDHFGENGGPLVLSYRVNAGPVPDSHWYKDRRQGGRLIGEVCHFIDTCNAIVGRPVVQVQAVGSGEEALLADDVLVSLKYQDGSMATIAYASGGHPSITKERLEVLGRRRSAIIDDFSKVILDGVTTGIRPQDKGHQAQLLGLRDILAQAALPETESFLHSSRVTLQAAASLLQRQI